jgi:hypothetical protein
VTTAYCADCDAEVPRASLTEIERGKWTIGLCSRCLAAHRSGKEPLADTDARGSSVPDVSALGAVHNRPGLLGKAAAAHLSYVANSALPPVAESHPICGAAMFISWRPVTALLRAGFIRPTPQGTSMDIEGELPPQSMMMRVGDSVLKVLPPLTLLDPERYRFMRGRFSTSTSRTRSRGSGWFEPGPDSDMTISLECWSQPGAPWIRCNTTSIYKHYDLQLATKRSSSQ